MRRLAMGSVSPFPCRVPLIGGSTGVLVGMGVAVAIGVAVIVGVEVIVGVAVGPNNCPGAQLDMTRLKSKTNIIAVRCLVFIISPALSRAHPADSQTEPHNFL